MHTDGTTLDVGRLEAADAGYVPSLSAPHLPTSRWRFGARAACRPIAGAIARAHSDGMKQVMSIRRMVELSNSGGSPSADEAMVILAAVIDHLDKISVTHAADVEALIGVGSAVWTLSGPGGEQAGASLRLPEPGERIPGRR